MFRGAKYVCPNFSKSARKVSVQIFQNMKTFFGDDVENSKMCVYKHWLPFF